LPRTLRLLLAAALCGLLLVPAGASAKRHHAHHRHHYRVLVGMGDQNAAMFDARAYRRLHIRYVRYVVAWNAMRHRGSRHRTLAYLNAARHHHQRVFLHVSTGDYRIKKGHLPSKRQYRRWVGKLVRSARRRGVREFGAWNEVNHASEPTWNHPKRAAQYFRLMRKLVIPRCHGCKVVGLDLLDQRGVTRYVRRFVRGLGRAYARRHLDVVGVHNYSDVNRHRTRGLREIMRAVRRYTHKRPHFWLTETGGIVKLGHSWKCNARRAARRLGYLFTTMRRYRHHLQRVYLYNWTGAGCHARFDAGLTNRRGKPRKGYYVVKRRMRDFRH
jgi:hypothetical protein